MLPLLLEEVLLNEPDVLEEQPDLEMGGGGDVYEGACDRVCLRARVYSASNGDRKRASQHESMRTHGSVGDTLNYRRTLPSRTHGQAHTHACTCTITRERAHTHTHTHTYTDTPISAPSPNRSTNTHAHTRTHQITCTPTPTPTPTHTPASTKRCGRQTAPPPPAQGAY